jgi:hypothetical protein
MYGKGYGVWDYGVDSADFGWCIVAGLCEHGDEPSSSIKGRLGCYQLSMRILCEISGSRGDEYEGGRCVLEYRLDDGGSKFFETSVSIYHTTWCNMPQDIRFQRYCSIEIVRKTDA